MKKNTLSMDKHQGPILEIPCETIDERPVSPHKANTVLNMHDVEFLEKLLCDGITFNIGDDETGPSIRIEDVLNRRKKVLELLKDQLLNEDGSRRFPDDQDNRVAFSTVDVAADMEQLRHIAAACNLILDNTGWKIRLLSRNHLLHRLIADEMIPVCHRKRLIFGFSWGTRDDQMEEASRGEFDLKPYHERLRSLHWLQDKYIKTFVMIGPSLPLDNYNAFAARTCEDIRVKKCEHVWVEVINRRGNSLTNTVRALHSRMWMSHAEPRQMIAGPMSPDAWEKYSISFFEDLTHTVPRNKLRYLQVVNKSSVDWWANKRKDGAVLLGTTARKRNLTVTVSPLTRDERNYLMDRERIVTSAIRGTFAAAKAVFEIHDYNDGRLWKCESSKFEAYCRKRWNFERSHSFRLVKFGRLIAALEREYRESQSPIGDCMPKNEGQFRPLTDIPEEHCISCWKEIVATTESNGRTYKVIEQKVKQYRETHGLEVQGCLSQESRVAAKISRLLEKLRAATVEHNNGHAISQILDQIQASVA